MYFLKTSPNICLKLISLKHTYKKARSIYRQILYSLSTPQLTPQTLWLGRNGLSRFRPTPLRKDNYFETLPVVKAVDILALTKSCHVSPANTVISDGHYLTKQPDAPQVALGTPADTTNRTHNTKYSKRHFIVKYLFKLWTENTIKDTNKYSKDYHPDKDGCMFDRRIYVMDLTLNGGFPIAAKSFVDTARSASAYQYDTWSSARMH
jgi:hypothetical protein